MLSLYQKEEEKEEEDEIFLKQEALVYSSAEIEQVVQQLQSLSLLVC